MSDWVVLLSASLAVLSAGIAGYSARNASRSRRAAERAEMRALRQEREPRLVLDVGKPDMKWGTPFNVVLRSDRDFEKMVIHADNQLGDPITGAWAGGLHADPLDARRAVDEDLRPARPNRTRSLTWILVAEPINAGPLRVRVS